MHIETRPTNAKDLLTRKLLIELLETAQASRRHAQETVLSLKQALLAAEAALAMATATEKGINCQVFTAIYKELPT